MSGLKLDLSDVTLEQLERHGTFWSDAQRLCNWAIGDVARKARSVSEDFLAQVFPVGISPGLIARCEAVSRAYPNDDDRNPLCTWSQHMQNANKPDRKELLQAIAEAGLTTDESRRTDGAPATRWLLAVDVNYHLHRHYHSGAGVEAAMRVAEWVQRTVARLKEKGLTDVACCLDSRRNFRKELTAEWEDKYKDRPPKDPELIQQIQLVGELLTSAGFCCATVDGMEADDVLASYAIQFDGRVTILSQDKDMKQCLSETCNMLTDVKWSEDPTGGEMVPDYKWLSAKQHTEMTGIRPDQWTDYQAIWGDNVDGIKGVIGVGEKGAKDLILEFGTIEAAIEAARDGDARIKERNRDALIQFSERVDIVRQLVTLRTDVSVPTATRI